MKEYPVNTSICIMCGEIVTHTVMMRRYCRGNDCRLRFYKLKQHWKKNQRHLLNDEEKRLFDGFVVDGTFEAYKPKPIPDKPFII